MKKRKYTPNLRILIKLEPIYKKKIPLVMKLNLEIRQL